jgi:hypothetical protein
MPTSNFITSDAAKTTSQSSLGETPPGAFPSTYAATDRSGRVDPDAPDWVQSISPAEYAGIPSPPSRFRRFATPAGLMPKWLLALAWIGLGLPTMALAVYSLAVLFLSNTKPTTPSGEVNHELLLLVCVSVIVNFCALVLFSILGRETARHRRSLRRRQWER